MNEALLSSSAQNSTREESMRKDIQEFRASVTKELTMPMGVTASSYVTATTKAKTKRLWCSWWLLLLETGVSRWWLA